ncbi:hypothetical protein DFH07DRAFT_771644 [Mycena maculata]|uniref:Uncharacterized protein n=1 Tax=Mycena maculata TaxID=230809 RepID=A0AAD7JAN6_9AGAR|nr:hypothetical protein DFH07DRAFT_771644 [Mycena maculata]
MLVLILLYYISQAAFTGSIPIDSDAISSSVESPWSNYFCLDAQHCRTIWNIIWSSLTTIFSCTWVAVRPNIPSPVKTQAMSFWERLWHSVESSVSNRLRLFVIALFVPECILAWAIRQWLEAGRIARKHEDSDWTRAHGFFVIMGGFHLFESPLDGPREENGKPPQQNILAEPPFLHPHTNGNPIRRIDEKELFSPNNGLQFSLPTEREITDRCKGDGLAKSFVLIQTTWFLMQCIARGIERLPVTKLELVACAYAIVNSAVYFFWWNKPLSAGFPVRVLGTPGAPQQQLDQLEATEWLFVGHLAHIAIVHVLGVPDADVSFAELKMAPMFWSNTLQHIVFLADAITSLIGVLFGAIHCIAWSFPFPSLTEGMLWRISCAGMVVLPSLLLPIGWLLFRFPVDFKLPEWVQRLLTFFLLGLLLLATLVYIFGRITTLTLALTTLRSLPPAAYETVHWTTFIPHV